MEDAFEIFDKSLHNRLQDQALVSYLSVSGDHDLTLGVRPERGHEPALQDGPDLVGQEEDGSLEMYHVDILDLLCLRVVFRAYLYSKDKCDPLVVMGLRTVLVNRLHVDHTAQVLLGLTVRSVTLLLDILTWYLSS